MVVAKATRPIIHQRRLPREFEGRATSVAIFGVASVIVTRARTWISGRHPGPSTGGQSDGKAGTLRDARCALVFPCGQAGNMQRAGLAPRWAAPPWLTAGW